MEQAPFRIAITCVLLVLAESANARSALAQATAQQPQPVNRFVHTPDIGTLVKPVLNSQGFLDPEFARAVAAPSKYMADFFGLQAITDVQKGRILLDFVPAHAERVAEDSVSITLKFKAGFTAQFYPVSSLSVAGALAPISHVALSGSDWRSVEQNVDRFFILLNSLNLLSAYLLPNTAYDDEMATYRQLHLGSPAVVTADSSLDTFSQTDGVLLIGERVHGRPEDITIVRRVLQTTNVDWLGMEMLDVSKQPVLDVYNRTKAGTTDHSAARANLIEYYANAWNGRAGPKTTGADNPYFQLVELAHSRGVRVVALEAAPVPYLLFRYGEAEFGGAVRSYWWSQHVPRGGRGIVFGGSAHFNSGNPVNVQDFLVTRQHGRTMFSLKRIEKVATR